jgi:hypothetical protein
VENSTTFQDEKFAKELSYLDQNVNFQYNKNLRYIKSLNDKISSDRYNSAAKVGFQSELKRMLFLTRELEKARVIFLYKNKKFPSGLLPRFLDYLYSEKIDVEVLDKRKKPKTNQIKFVTQKPLPQLRYCQKDAVKLAVSEGRGILVMPTGVGKTVTAVKIVWELGLPTLFVAPSKSIAEMMFDTMTEFFGKGKVEKITSKTKVTKKPIGICNIQGLIKVPPSAVKQFQVVVIDEFHHCLVGGTKLFTDKGVKSIKQVFDFEEEIKVLSFDKQAKQFEFKKVLNKFEYNAPTSFIKIHLDNGKKLVLTEDHLVLTNTGYKKAKELKCTDILIDGKYTCFICNKNFEDECSLGGHIAGHLTPTEVKLENAKRMLASPNWNSEKARKLNSKSKMGDKNPSKRPEVRKKKSESQKRWFNSLSSEEKAWRIQTFVNAPLQGLRKGPTSLERRIIELNIKDLRFVGDGSLWFKSKNRYLNPDFIKGNKVIEVGDVEFWHSQEDIEERIKLLANVGLECLYLTSDQLKLLNNDDLKKVVQEYLNG